MNLPRLSVTSVFVESCMWMEAQAMTRSGHVMQKRQGAISVFSLKSFKEKWGGRMEKEVEMNKERWKKKK